MAVMDLVFYPNDILREECEKVDTFDTSLLDLVDNLKDTLEYWGGLGLAAPQIGVKKRVFVLNMSLLSGANEGEGSEEETDIDTKVFINPRISEKAGEDTFREGCLSIPGVTSEVTRALCVNVRSQDVMGDVFDHEATGYEAAAIQHELDHLDGILYLDHLSGLKRRMTMKKYKKVHKKHIRKKRE